jgi:hypothetical protein
MSGSKFQLGEHILSIKEYQTAIYSRDKVSSVTANAHHTNSCAICYMLFLLDALPTTEK